MQYHRDGDVLGGSLLIDALNRGWCTEPGLCAASVGCGESGSPASLGGVSALACAVVSAGSRPRPLSSVTRFSIFRTAVAALVWAQPPSSVERNSAYMLCASTSSCHAAAGTGAPAVRLPCTDGSARLTHPNTTQSGGRRLDESAGGGELRHECFGLVERAPGHGLQQQRLAPVVALEV